MSTSPPTPGAAGTDTPDPARSALPAPAPAPAPGSAPSHAPASSRKLGPSEVTLPADVSSSSDGAARPAPGATFLPSAIGGYEIIDELARGGMGVIYRARQSGLGRIVALKVMLEGPFASPDQLERFLREARAAARLQHPCIVPIHEVGSVGGRPFFSMDYVEGLSLDAFVAEHSPSPRAILDAVRQVTEAVAYAHAQGVIHRDIKPQNILVDAGGRPHLLDFGLAKDLRDAGTRTRAGLAIGTPAYMPPEQARGRVDEIDERSDVYCLGAVLYQAFTRRAPFEGEDAPSVLREVVYAEPTAPRRLVRDLHREIETIILKAMAKEKAARYASASALAEDLGRFLDARPILARPQGLAERAVRFLRRHRVAVATVVLAAFVAGLAVEFFFLRVARRQEADRLTAEAKVALERILATPPDRVDPADWNRQVDGVLATLDRAVRLDRGHAASRLKRGLAREAREDAAGALADFQAAAGLDPSDGEATYHLGRSLTRTTGRRDEGLALLQACAGKGGPWARIAEARAALVEGREVQAVTAARQAIEDAGEKPPPEAFRLLGSAYARWAEDFDQKRAQKEVERGLDLCPGYTDLYVARSAILYDLLSFSKALADCRKARARLSDPELDHLEARILLANRDYKGVLERAEAMLSSGSGHPEAPILKGEALHWMGRREEFAAHAARLYDQKTPLSIRALALLRNRELDFGLVKKQELLQAARSLPRAFATVEEGDRLAQLFYLIPALKEADEVTAELVRRFPDHARAHATRGYYLMYAGKTTEAIEESGRAIALAPECANYRWLRAQLRPLVYQFPEAVEDATETLKLWPARSEALGMLAGLQFFLGSREKAAEAYVELALRSYFADMESEIASLSGKGAKARATWFGTGSGLSPASLLLEIANGLCRRGETYLASGELAMARRAFGYALLAAPGRHDAMIGLARAYVRGVDEVAALEFLERAERAGYRDADALLKSPELGPLQKSLRFRALVQRMREGGAGGAGGAAEAKPTPGSEPGGAGGDGEK
ncbi:MAG: protein kinase [Planctomycetes bacterium]|nr:protein kinase [Planctomycetota bacterium]